MYREATSTLCCTRTKLRVKNFLHFLNHPLGLSPQKTGKSIIGRGGLYPVLWWSWLPMRSLRARILNPCNMPSWLLWVPTSFSTGGVFKTPSELATTSLPSIWLARKDWYWVVSASIYRLIWLVFLFSSAPSIILSCHFYCWSEIDSRNSWRISCSCSSSFLQRCSTAFILLFFTILNQNESIKALEPTLFVKVSP